MSFLPFLLLGVSLLLFLFSTRQMALRIRLLVWLVGLLGLAGAAVAELSRGDHTGLLAVLGDFIAHIGNPDESLLVRSVGGNWASVASAIAPMFDVFLIIAAIIAVVALIALTPGDAIERAERPVNIALIGAILGALAALAVTSIGLGGATKRKVYMSMVQAEDVIDGDTIRMGDVSLRLWGIDAPESDQLCRGPQNEPYACGEPAREHLVSLIGNDLVVCGPPVAQNGRDLPPGQMPPLKETFGRPIVMCHVSRNGQRIDLARQMAADGYAHVFEDATGVKSDYTREVVDAALARKGLHNQEFLPPWQWRNDPGERCFFLDRIGLDKLEERLRKTCVIITLQAQDPQPPTTQAPTPAPKP
jgi:endonuclease YncB( thermonuclease family)